MRAWTRSAAAALLVTVMGVGACGDKEEASTSPTTSDAGPGAGGEDDHGGEGGHGGGEEPAFSAADADTTVKLTTTDFAFTNIPASVTGKKVLFEVSNEGPSEHEFVVFERGADDAVGGVGPFAKGKTETLAAELEPGSYTAKCFIKAGGQTHAELGMQTDFTVS